MRLLLKIIACGALLFMVAGCNATTTCAANDCETPLAPAIVTVVCPYRSPKWEHPDDVKYYRSDEPLRLGIELSNRGHFGIAELYFRDATEKAPKHPTAWIGLAAAYDRLARFDLADRAYAYAI